ncbi:PEP-CTERM sorting domain-containing protein [Roseibium album]|uniref:VPLPA-CTERM protein sorting domain-containing protein n=1 Tax=Roseibium album TaxID=311410 RepID=A0A0M7AFN7_9HYPH|nr:PEP-CTERM sorting domain-containing protein [Roseibium album]CTQ58900.1 hypothetical protein LA5094_01661 [Roseibium album]CTQ63638.1 hypothetical protein LA5096_00084 [Roseibium album]CTQ73226.1 hypothetical protein LA5095_02715 [Roseibium album]
MKRFLSFAVAATALLFATHASALTYNEAVDGDIVPIFVQNIGLGTTTITGQAVSTCSAGASCSVFSNDVDDFFLPFGSFLANGSLTLNVTGPSGGFVNSSGTPLVGGGILSGPLNTGVNTFVFADFSTSEARFFIDSGGFVGGSTAPLTRTIDYTLTLSVFDPSATVVPLPAALPLLASGIGLLGIAGWRRRKSAAA